MKASLKFRDDQKPLFRAKIPLNLLGFPFQSGIAAGESKELGLSLGTLFQSGPSLKIAYRPNDSWNPFSLLVKTGIGPYGSPDSASMTMSAEFNPLELGNPRFFIHFRPQLGDFSIKKSQSSVFNNTKVGLQNGVVSSDDEGSLEVVERPVMDRGYTMADSSFSGDKTASSRSKLAADGLVRTILSGVEVSARTALPVRNGAVLRCRWCVRFPAELTDALTDRKARVSFQKLPTLVMNKISIEHTTDSRSKERTEICPSSYFPDKAELAEACFAANRQIRILQTENEFLKKAVEGLRSDIAGGSSENPSVGATDPGKFREGGRSGIRPPCGKVDRRDSGDKKKPSEFNTSVEADVKE